MIRNLAFWSLATGLLLAGETAHGAICTWNTASGNWSVVGNWSGCADGGGVSTRTPGASDTAVVVNGTASLDVSPAVAEFELGANGVLSVVGGTKTFDVSSALRFSGGHATTILGTNQLLLYLHAGATGTLLAPTTLENAVFFENSGALTLGSASGVALNLLCCAEVRNMPGGTITIAGGNSAVYLGGGSQLINNLGASLAIAGNTTIGHPPSGTSNGARLTNFGSMTVTGPATLDMPFGSFSNFYQLGSLTVTNATVACLQTGTSTPCVFRDQDGSAQTGAVTRLAGGTLDLGDASSLITISPGATLTGSGTVIGNLNVQGMIAPGGNGAPYGSLAVNGTLAVQAGSTIALDLGGTSAGTFDRIQVSGNVRAGNTTTFPGYGNLVLHLASGFQPALGAASAAMTYASVDAGSQFNRVDANYALDYAARFDPTALQVFPAPRVTLEGASLIEGASGMMPMGFNVRLSQPFSQTVSVELRNRDGTAVSGGTPAGDYGLPDDYVFTFAPGEVLKTQVYPINGDTVIEADESFSVEIYRNKVINAAIGTGIQGGPIAIGTILTDDLPPNTRFVLVGKDSGTTGRKIRRYTNTGMFIDTWDDRMPNNFGNIVTGMCFSPSGNMLATRFSWPDGPILYSHFGAILDEKFARNIGSTVYFNNHESCVFDHAGNVYIGQAGTSSSPDDQVPVRKFDRYGNLLDTYVIPTGPRGTDWIELAGDGCTLYYTSEDTVVRRYNVCTHTALSDFATGLTGPYCYALRLRPNRELMVACQDAVHRLSPQGTNLHTYPRASLGETDPSGLFALNLDPDGTSFWTAGALSGDVYRVEIETGSVLASFNSGSGGVAGLAVYDELADDILFVDGFELAPPNEPIVKREPQPRCEYAFWPEVREMPHYVPSWIVLVGVPGDTECKE